MLLADPACRNDTPGGERQRVAENGLRHEYALGMVPERTVTEVSDDRLRRIEPVVDILIIFNAAAPFLHAGEGVMVWMCHGSLPQNVWLLVWKSL